MYPGAAHVPGTSFGAARRQTAHRAARRDRLRLGPPLPARFNGEMPQNRRDPDYLLAPENDKSLNETFYRARPYAYFNQRLECLLLVAGKADRLSDLLAE